MRKKLSYIKEDLYTVITDIFGECWDQVLKESRDELRLHVSGVGTKGIYLELMDINGNLVRRRSMSSALIDDLENFDGTCGRMEEVEWCYAMAADFERQAKRCRQHGKKLEKKLQNNV